MPAVVQKIKHPLALLLAGYWLLASATLLTWQNQSKYYVTGDEPHYLVMANGILHFATLEQSQSYKKEFFERNIDIYGLADPGATPNRGCSTTGYGHLEIRHDLTE